MDKITYLAELAEGLARWVPERERQDILRYYAEYFEEAGPGREAEVVAELGDPWALSCRLAVEGGYVTYEKAASWRPGKKWPRVLLGTAVGLSIFALVFGFGMLAFNVIRTKSHDPKWVEAVALPADASGMSGVFEMMPDGSVTIVDSGYVVFAQDAEFVSSRFSDGQSVASFSSIDVNIGLGNIDVVAGDDFTLSISLSDALSGYTPVWEVRDGVLRIRDGGASQATSHVFAWDDLKKLFSANQLVVDMIITVPEGAALGKISVKTGLGSVLLNGVNAETVAAETGVGDVECYEARNVRSLELNTGVGHVILDMEKVGSSQSLNANLKSGTGSVEAYLGCSEKECQYELESGLGIVTVNGSVRGSNAERKGSMPYRLSAESGTGGVNLYFTG